MVWEPILWLVFFVMNMLLIASNIYQIICLTDLETDYLNAYDSSSHINAVILPEFILHGALCTLFLLTGHWIFFLITLPLAYFNLRKFMTRQHLIDVTEVVRNLDAEKKLRIFKLTFYLIVFVLVIVRAFAAGGFATLRPVFRNNNEGLDIRSSILEF